MASKPSALSSVLFMRFEGFVFSVCKSCQVCQLQTRVDQWLSAQQSHSKTRPTGRKHYGDMYCGAPISSSLVFWAGNLGNSGVNSVHVHEVASDIMTNKCRLSRYEPVGLIQIPAHLLETFRMANKEKCGNDPLILKCSPAMEYVCADHCAFLSCSQVRQRSNQHFVE